MTLIQEYAIYKGKMHNVISRKQMQCPDRISLIVVIGSYNPKKEHVYGKSN